jgi:hypothetical protein
MWTLGSTTLSCGLACCIGGRSHPLAWRKPLYEMSLHSDEGIDRDVGPSGVTIPPTLLSNPARGTSVYLPSICRTFVLPPMRVCRISSLASGLDQADLISFVGGGCWYDGVRVAKPVHRVSAVRILSYPSDEHSCIGTMKR